MDRQESSAGFTLIEVLVALTILALSLAVLLYSISAGLDASRRAALQARAARHAQNLLAEAGVTMPIDKPAQSGEFGDGFSWRIRATPYGSADDQAAWPFAAVSLVIDVMWTDDRTRKQLELSTIKAAPGSAP